MGHSFAAEKNKSQSTTWKSIKKASWLSVLTVYHLRKVVMALPVIYYALKLAIYNEQHLPVEVGLFLQNNGDFLQMVSRSSAVLMPLLLTCGCLFLMLFSRKAMYAWAISIFTLALPVIILISNIYPA